MVAYERWTLHAALINVAWILLLRTVFRNPVPDPNGLGVTVAVVGMVVFYLGAALLMGLGAVIGFQLTLSLAGAFAIVWLAFAAFMPTWTNLVAFGLQLPLLYASYRAHRAVQRRKTGKLSPLDLPVFG